MTEIYAVYYVEYVGGWREFEDHPPILYYTDAQDAQEICDAVNASLKANLRATNLKEWDEQKRKLAQYELLKEKDLLSSTDKQPGVWQDIETTIETHWMYASKYHVRTIKLADNAPVKAMVAFVLKHGGKNPKFFQYGRTS